MEKIDVGIISSCRSFRIALDTILSCESDGYVSSIWSKRDLDIVLNGSEMRLTKPDILILDAHDSQVPVSTLLEIVRRTFKRVKVIVMLGKCKVDLQLIKKYQINKILKRGGSEDELLSAVRFCFDN